MSETARFHVEDLFPPLNVASRLGAPKMDQFMGLVASTAVFFSFVAYCEARDFLQTGSPRLSRRQARAGGALAAAAILGLYIFGRQMLAQVPL